MDGQVRDKQLSVVMSDPGLDFGSPSFPPTVGGYLVDHLIMPLNPLEMSSGATLKNMGQSFSLRASCSASTHLGGVIG
ncbi:hypothetical protein Trydic_g6770 [Trypoxylus dichotomus]